MPEFAEDIYMQSLKYFSSSQTVSASGFSTVRLKYPINVGALSFSSSKSFG
jgi:hypothetical protein